jgi:hypothetical protein
MRYALLIFAVSMLKGADVSKEEAILDPPGIKFLSIFKLIIKQFKTWKN